MANERKTESIVRKHFGKYSGIVIEEQKSENISINKLLKNASKKGEGKGYPEFIISFKHYPELLIIVECKADVTKHESKSKDKYSEYSVDGVLLYSSFLSKEYDVIAIAVSGETHSKLSISHFLHLKGEKAATPIFSDKLLSSDNYLNGYLKSPEKFRQDYFKLLQFTKELNEKLHHEKIEEDKRSLLISSILIALESRAFKTSYPLIGCINEEDTPKEKKLKIENAPKELANLLVDTVINQLKSANIQEDKLENLKIQYSFIRTDTSLSTKEGVLKNIVESIDKNINTFIKTHEYFDVLGQLYIEFLRYANSDKGLGIVLTPPHITELFADLARANKNSVVYDNCTGTGGFLISAMKRMIHDAKEDTSLIRKIKQKQLFGVEYQSKIFALAVSNMFIHQDGKSNVLQGSCFDEKIVKFIKSKKPTIGLLNPPYKANKKEDTEELEYVLNNLNCLSDGGVCIAIVPMQCALAQKGEILRLKKMILQKHTLEAVMSMPDELFFNSDVGVVTCTMVFTAHKPHPRNKETYFGYWKDDGFVKRKEKGRIDFYQKWDKIKNQWLESYTNRKSIPGISIMKSVTADDEWVAEAYMETDYKSLSKEDFIKTLKSFVLINELYFKNEISIA
jgi:type I restriction enzyme M protein